MGQRFEHLRCWIVATAAPLISGFVTFVSRRQSGLRRSRFRARRPLATTATAPRTPFPGPVRRFGPATPSRAYSRTSDGGVPYPSGRQGWPVDARKGSGGGTGGGASSELRTRARDASGSRHALRRARVGRSLRPARGSGSERPRRARDDANARSAARSSGKKRPRGRARSRRRRSALVRPRRPRGDRSRRLARSARR